MAVFISLSWQTQAQSRSSDVKLFSKVLSFVEPKLPNSIPIAIIFDRNEPSSLQDSEIILEIIEEELSSGRRRFNVSRVDVSQLSNLSSSRVILLTNGINKKYKSIKSIASRYGLIAMSTDLKCVENGFCSVGIVSGPKISIVVNSTAAQAASIKFSPAFLMMVREVK